VKIVGVLLVFVGWLLPIVTLGIAQSTGRVVLGPVGNRHFAGRDSWRAEQDPSQERGFGKFDFVFA